MDAQGARIDELPALWDGFARLVRPGLGLSAFGANVMNLPPDYATKSHDESQSGQEELYVRLSGSGAVVLDDDGTELPLDADHTILVSTIDKAVKRGALHRNTGARKKSRAARVLRGDDSA